ncbi:hypothetical protein EVC37_10775 [Methylocaldum sp. BRCS4]|nr:hypothetical protein [Methylocaldum sp. BRCS4]
MPTDLHRIRTILDQTLAWSKGQGYLEHTKHDALNSPLLYCLLGRHKLTRILATQAVMRFPVNLRKLLRVPKSHNPKGLALFVMALLDSFTLTREHRYLMEAERLLALLLALRSPGNWGGYCWGYQYPWQDLGFFAPKAMPNAVVTAFVCEAFLHAYRVTGKSEYVRSVESAAGFFLNNLTVLKRTGDELCLGYMPLPMTMRVMDVSILIAAVLAQLAKLNGDGNLRETATCLARYVVNRQTSEGAWFYTDPPKDSPVKIDNYHTGFILDALDRVLVALGNEEWRSNHDCGVKFYAAHLFNSDGSPRWMSDQNYPYDIHGAAQGILTFAQTRNRERYPELAPKIVNWALTRMYHPEGRFFYQENRFYRKKITFIRWCNAWMCHALARFALMDAQHEEN